MIDNDILWNILANPADAKYAFTLNVDTLVDEFPQSSLFRALLAGNGNEENVRHAAAYFNPATLYKLINTPDSLPVVTSAQIYQVDAPLADTEVNRLARSKPVDKIYEELNITPPLIEDFPAPDKDEEDDAVNQDIDSAEGEPEKYTAFEETTTPHDEETVETDVADNNVPEPEIHNTDTFDNPWSGQEEEPPAYIPDEPVAEDKPAEAIIDWAPVQQETIEEVQPPELEVSQPEPSTPGPETAPVNKSEDAQQEIDDEVFDEIVSIEDINLEQLAAFNAIPRSVKITESKGKLTSEVYFVYEPPIVEEEELKGAEEPAKVESPEQAAPVNENRVEESYGQNFHTYETNEAEVSHDEEAEYDVHPHIPAIIVPANEIVAEANSSNNVSKYFDENLPYTFMWWLDKTRREHASAYAYQPYVTNPASNYSAPESQSPTTTINNPVDELQQQYVANIFNVSVLDDLERSATTERPEERKEDKIIKRFIQAEPHIKNAGDIKLDNENKAKRSSEDGDELITETLARIYTEQMLYPKAIAAYKKLMLKFPEKSLYFAGQIEQLEKKPN